MKTLELWEVIPINKDEEFQYYITNNSNYKGKIKIPIEKKGNFESTLANGAMSVEKWNTRIVKESIKYSEKVKLE